MIIVFAEDGMVAVLDDLAAVRRECEGIDVEDGVYAFYADDGAWLRARFTRPNRRGFFGSVQSGEYVLEREPSPPVEVRNFDAAITAAAGLQPNDHFATLDAVRAHVAASRAALARYLIPPG
jgi:hypothetical protein